MVVARCRLLQARKSGSPRAFIIQRCVARPADTNGGLPFEIPILENAVHVHFGCVSQETKHGSIPAWKGTITDNVGTSAEEDPTLISLGFFLGGGLETIHSSWLCLNHGACEGFGFDFDDDDEAAASPWEKTENK